MRAEMYASKEDITDMAEGWVSSLRSRRRWPGKPRKAALLVLDMQRFFLEEGHAFVPAGRSIIGPITELLETFKGPILFTKHVHDDDPANLMNVWWRDSIKGRDAEIVDPIRSFADTILEKIRYSAFEGTDLAERLMREGVDSVLIAGVLTDLCCETTARDAFMKGFRVYFLADCTATATEARHTASLRVISEGFGEVMTWRKAMSLL